MHVPLTYHHPLLPSAAPLFLEFQIARACKEPVRFRVLLVIELNIRQGFLISWQRCIVLLESAVQDSDGCFETDHISLLLSRRRQLNLQLEVMPKIYFMEGARVVQNDAVWKIKYESILERISV